MSGDSVIFPDRTVRINPRKTERRINQTRLSGTKPSLPCAKGGGPRKRDGGIVKVEFYTKTPPQSASLTAPLTQGSLPLRRELCNAKAFWNHQQCRWFSFHNKKGADPKVSPLN